MSKLCGTFIRIKVDNELLYDEYCHYYSNDKVIITLLEDTCRPSFVKWYSKLGEKFTLTIDEETIKASGKYILTRVGIMAKFEDVVKTNLIFNKL